MSEHYVKRKFIAEAVAAGAETGARAAAKAEGNQAAGGAWTEAEADAGGQPPASRSDAGKEKLPINKWPVEDRPREKLLEKGPQSLTEAELIAIFLRCGVQGRSAVDLGRTLLKTFGSVRNILTADKEKILAIHGMGPARYVALLAALELSRRHFEHSMREGSTLANPKATRDYLRLRLRDLQHEVFCCLFLDNRHKVIAFEELFRGTIDGASVHPREVIKRALSRNAAAVIFAHNHPSGVAEPSHADELITRRLKEALALVDIRVLDHLIVGDGQCESMAERGMI